MQIEINSDYIYIDIYAPRVIKIHVSKIDKKYGSVKALHTRDIIGYNILFSQLDSTMVNHNYLVTSIFGYLLEPNKETAVKLMKQILKKRTTFLEDPTLESFKNAWLTHKRIRANVKQIIQLIKQLEV